MYDLKNLTRPGERKVALADRIRSAEGLVLLPGRSARRMRIVLRRLAGALAPTCAVASIDCRNGAGFAELIAACCASLGIADDGAGPLPAFADFVSARMERGQATALLIEGSDALSGETLAKLAQLALLEEGGERPLRIVVTGASALAARSDGPKLALGGEAWAVTRVVDGVPRGMLRLAVGGGLAAVAILASMLAGQGPAPPLSPPLPAAVSTEQAVSTQQAVTTEQAVNEAPDAAPVPEEPPKTGAAALFARAQRELAEGKLDSPENDNAFRTYQQIVLLAPDDPAGPRLLSMIRERGLDQAREVELPGGRDGASFR
jgi:hypothetical protein